MSDAANISIVRAARRQRFTMIDNRILGCDYLSFEAMALLVHLLHRPDNWQISLQQLAAHLKLGRDKVQKLMKELRDAGHACKIAKHDAGRFQGSCWKICEERGSFDEGASDAGEHNRAPENQVVCERSDSLKTDSLKTRRSKEQIMNIQILPPKAPLADDRADGGPTFEDFERVYPFDGEEPCGAARYFNALRPDERRKVLAHAPGYVAERKGRGLATPQKYLRCRIWETQGIRGVNAATGAPVRYDARRPASTGSARPNAGYYQKPDGTFFLRPDSPNLSAWKDYERRNGLKSEITPVRPAPWPPGHEATWQAA